VNFPPTKTSIWEEEKKAKKQFQHSELKNIHQFGLGLIISLRCEIRSTLGKLSCSAVGVDNEFGKFYCNDVAYSTKLF